MTAFGRILIDVLMLCVGWLLCMWWNGLLIASDTASSHAQSTGEQFILADKRITAATDGLDKASERVRIVTKEVPVYVSPDCPPGSGAVSDSAAERLRAAVAKANAATAAGRVRTSGN